MRHNPAASRYEIDLGAGRMAVAEYVTQGTTRVFTHTFVPPEFRGGGLAEKLVRAALDDTHAERIKVLPACSYVAVFLRRHPEYQALLAGEG